MTKILDCQKINKKFGKKQVLKDVSFSLEQGDVMGFIGPNGAGKTTAIKLILGLQNINSGKALINGYDVEQDFENAIKKVGAIVENPDSYMYLTGRQNLENIARIHGKNNKQEIEKLIKLVKLEQTIDDKVSKYSLGMRQRLGIAKALINQPNLLVLDEPTNGLDPEGMKELRFLLKKLSTENGISILISSHNLAEIEAICNKIVIIQNGVIVESNSVENFKKIINNTNYIIEFEQDVENLNLADILGQNYTKLDHKKIKLALEPATRNQILKKLVENNIAIVQIIKEEVKLEDAFINKVGGNKIV